MIVRCNRTRWIRLNAPLAALLCLGLMGPGCEQGAGTNANPLADPEVEQAVADVKAGKKDPRELRNLVKTKLSGKEQKKAIPKQPPGRRRAR